MPDNNSHEQTSTSAPRSRGSRIDEYREFVGILNDSEVAAKAGVTASAVTQYRHRYGIAAAMPQGANRRGRKPGKRQGKKGQLQTRDRTPAADKLIAPHAHLLGVASDMYIGEVAGVAVADVRAYRERHQIGGAPPSTPTGRSGEAPAEASEDREYDRAEPTNGRPPVREATPREPTGRRSRIDAYQHLLGVVSDREVANRAGVTANAVQMYRKKYGIPPAGLGRQPRRAEPTRAPEPRRAEAPRAEAPRAEAPRAQAPRAEPPRVESHRAEAPRAAAPRSSSSTKAFAWKITLATAGGEVTRIAVASDAASASALASGYGDVVALERVAEALT